MSAWGDAASIDQALAFEEQQANLRLSTYYLWLKDGRHPSDSTRMRAHLQDCLTLKAAPVTRKKIQIEKTRAIAMDVNAIKRKAGSGTTAWAVASSSLLLPAAP